MRAEARTPVLPLSVDDTNSAIGGSAAWAFCALVLIGYIVFRWEGTLARGTHTSVERALFFTVNALTLTGFQLNLAIDHYNPRGQWMMLLLTIAGTQFALILGGIALARIARLPYSDKQVVSASIILQVLVILVGGLVAYRSDQPILAAMLQACSAFGNSGLWMGASPELMDWRTHVLLLLAFFGGLGVPVLLDLVDAARRRRALSHHSRVVLRLSALVYLSGVILLFVFRWPANLESANSLLASSSEAALNTRSAGLPIEFAADFPRFLQWILILLMAIGAAPGGSGGGIKVTTIRQLLLGMREIFAGRNPGRLFGLAVVWLAGFILLVFTSLLVLLWTDPGLDADRLLFIATSAAANVGLAHDRVGIVGTGMHVLTITMLLGRILPIFVLWWVIRYADETDVAIG